MSTEKKGEKNAVYIGDNPVYDYAEIAFMNLQRAGTAKVMARGAKISKAIMVVHRVLKRFAGVRLIDEHTSIVELPDNRPPREDQPDEGRGQTHFRSPRPRPENGQKAPLRPVSVYEATLVYEPPVREKDPDIEIGPAKEA